MKRVSSWRGAETRCLGVLLLLLLGAGCQSDDYELRIGERTLTSEDVDAYLAFHLRNQAKGKRSPTREEFIPTIIHRIQLAQAAERQGIDSSPMVSFRRQADRKFAVLQELGPSVIDTVTTLDIDDAKEEYSRKNIERRARQIVVSEDTDAEEILHLLQKGARFDSLALARSEARRVRYTKGDLGYFKPDRLETAVDEVVFSLPVNDHFAVAVTKVGYHVLEVTDERLILPTNADSAYGEILQELVDLEIQRRSQKFLDDRFNSANVEWNESFIHMIARQYDATWVDARTFPSQFASDSSSALLYLEGEPISLGSCLTEMAVYDAGRRPILKSNDQVKSFFLGMCLENSLYREGVSQGIDKAPSVKEYEAMALEKYLARQADVLLKAKGADYAPSDDEIRIYFDKHRSAFDVPERIVIGEIVVPYADQARDADSLMNEGVPFKAVASRYSRGLTAKSGGRIGPFKQAYRPERWSQADTLEVGQRTQPFEAEGGWVIVELRKREAPRPQSLEDSRSLVVQKLKTLAEEAREREIQGLLDEWFPVKNARENEV